MPRSTTISRYGSHYAGTKSLWDVVNEIMNDGASGLRPSSNTNRGLVVRQVTAVFMERCISDGILL